MAAEIVYHRLKYRWLVAVAAGFAIFAVVGFYSARMTWTYPDYDAGRAKQRLETLKKVEQAENALLYPADEKGNPVPAKWADQDKNVIQIPIEEAMTHETAELKSVAPGIGQAIPGVTAVPMPTPAPAAASDLTNAAPAAPGASTNAAPAKPAKPGAPAKPKKKKPAAVQHALVPNIQAQESTT